MNKILTVASALLLSGCASQSVNTRDFYTQEQRIMDACMAPTRAMTPMQAVTVDPVTKSSPATAGAACYANQVISVASIMKYPNFLIVDQYARYTLALSQARDRGVISQATAATNHAQMTVLYRQAISAADNQRAADARVELTDRLAIFATAYANVAAEQQRQQQLGRPVVCTLTGVYKTTGVVCN